jgi:nitric oxide reductase NorQ protein
MQIIKIQPIGKKIAAFDANGNDITGIVPQKLRFKANDLGVDIVYSEGQYSLSADASDPAMMNLHDLPEVTEQLEISADKEFIHKSVALRPKELFISDLKWKYLVRSAVRGKNIMMTGPAGTGKTMAVKYLVDALKSPHFYFNLGATQDPRSVLVGNTHFNKETGTYFAESMFAKAIQTPGSIVLLDELSRAHPEAWNILMTVLDPNQRYMRLDEKDGAPTIKVAEGVCFIATANIGNEYTATRVLDRALMDRFITIEMDVLDMRAEFDLLSQKYPTVPGSEIEKVVSITSMIRKEAHGGIGKLSTMLSTRAAVELVGLLDDGFTLAEASEVAVYPFFSEDGGVDSERTFVKQVVQKFCPAPGTEAKSSLFGEIEMVEMPV